MKISPTPTPPHAELATAQRERLAFIEFRLYFLGDVRRQDLMDRFGIAPAAATRDFALYRELYPANMTLEGRSKTYIPTPAFQPGFTHDAERVLMMLSRGFGGGITGTMDKLLPCELPMTLNRPAAAILAPVTRAIHQQKAVKLCYFSRTSGLSEREIVPFALANNGLRWHVRAFDRKSGEFRDFVFTRMESAQLLDEDTPASHELAAQDHQWQRIVELELVPHPDMPDPAITQRDYGMIEGKLRLTLRSALAGYVLRQWQVDCTPDHRLANRGCRLWLPDVLTLYGVKSAVLAPGYVS